MTTLLKRPPSGAAFGLLTKEHSHSCWVTNNLDRAVEVFSNRYGVSTFSFIEASTPAGGHIRVAFAWAGGQVLEIIAATGPGFDFYNEMLPDEGFAIRFHHLGFLIESEEEWRNLEQELRETEWPITHSVLTGDFIDAYYIKAPELGHYLEYVRPSPAGNHFYNEVPQN